MKLLCRLFKLTQSCCEDIWSVRITRSYRALGIMDTNVVTWFWIGNHDEYERYFG